MLKCNLPFLPLTNRQQRRGTNNTKQNKRADEKTKNTLINETSQN